MGSSSLVNGISERGNGFASFVSEKENTFYEVESLTQVVVKGIIAASKGFISDVTLNGVEYPAYIDTAITTGTFVHVMLNKNDFSVEESTLEYSFRNINNIQGEPKTVKIDHYDLAHDTSLHDGGLIAIMAKKDLQQLQKEFEMAQYDQKDEFKQKMIDLSKISNVLCPKTAFVGVMVDENGVEKNNTSTAVDINISAENADDMGHMYGGPVYKSMSMSMPRSRGMSAMRLQGPPRAMAAPSMQARGPVAYSSPVAGMRGPVGNQAMSASIGFSGQSIARSMLSPTPAYDMDYMATEVATSRGPQFTTTTASTTTTTTAPGLHQLNSYLDLTNSQSVSGSWTFDDIKDYIQPDKLEKLKNLQNFNQDDISTISGIILLQEKFSSEKEDWSASADKAWDSMSFSSRMAARSLVRQVISLLELNLSN